jgi:hypothetical protein
VLGGSKIAGADCAGPLESLDKLGQCRA